MPTPEQVRRAIDLMSKRGANVAYFFQKVNSPEWIEPLLEHGFFRDPPPLVEVGDSIRYPIWPESRYLARMAAKAPDLVCRVVLAMPPTDNERIHEDFFEAATNMPPDLAKEIAAMEAAWIRSRSWLHLLIPDRAKDLILHLAAAGELAAAFDIWVGLLEVTGTSGSSATARLRSWDYGELLRLTTGPLVIADAQATLSVLCDLLKRALEVKGGHAEEGIDYSFIWRPTVVEEDGSSREAIEGCLVTAIHNAAKEAAEVGQMDIPDIVGILSSGGSSIFTRISLQLVSEFPTADQQTLDSLICDERLFDNLHVRAEYINLMRSAYGLASMNCQERILTWIEAGPPPKKAAAVLASGESESSEEMQRVKKIWQRNLLTPIRPYLKDAWLARYAALTQELGEVSDADLLPFRMWSGGFEGESSPKSLEELREMPSDELAAFLRDWTAPEGHMGPSVEGLAGVLRELAATDGAHIAEVAEYFIDTNPIYVREILTGLTKYLEHRHIEWAYVLRLGYWAAVNSSAAVNKEPFTREERAFRWAADAALDLIRDGMLRADTGLKFEHRDLLWSIVSELVEDEEPTPEQEADDLASNWSALDLSLNTTRSKAVDALMVYIVWVDRLLAVHDNTREKDLVGQMPEAVDALLAHLDPQRDPSLAVRSVYGRRFAWLVHADPAWAAAYAPLIFPREADHRAYWDVAWSAYLTNPTLHKDIVSILHDQYLHAIRLLRHGPTTKSGRFDPEERLAHQMMLLYLQGDLEIGTDSMLDDFYEHASEKVRGDALDFAGRAAGDLTDDMAKRVESLWESRLSIIRDDPRNHRDEVRAFGWIFVSGRFDPDWSIANLERALSLGAGVDCESRVVQRLAELAPNHPLSAVTCLRQMIKAEREEWDIYVWRESVRSVLTAGLESSSARELAEQVIGDLMATGHFEYRELLV